MKKAVVILILLAGGLVAAYTQRTAISDWMTEQSKPDVPAVQYQPEIEPIVDEEVETVPEEFPEDVIDEEETVPEETEEETVPTDPEVSGLPAEYNLAIPFTSQAPHANWDEVHQETCEEASSLMAAFYFMGEPAGKIDPDEAEAEIQKLIAFEESLFGYSRDTTASETATLIETYYHLSTELIQDPSVDDIIEAVAAGHPVIVPAAGRELGNPNFTPPGPLYHMFVVKGYTEDGFITNDPGTRLGADYFYEFDVVMSAIHDWNGGDVEHGEQVVIVVKP